MSFKTYWGDITDLEDVKRVVEDQDCIIHLAGIIPPLSERNPALAYNVNVRGTMNLIKAAKKQKKLPKFIFASSITVYGPKMNCEPPRCVDEPLNPTDNYTRHKVEIELRNNKESENINIIVEESFYHRQWKIEESNFPFDKKNVQKVEFNIPVKANGKSILTYTVLYSW